MAFSAWLSRATRAGGEWNTSNVTVPTNVDEVRIKLNLAATADFASANSLTMDVQVSADNAQTWTTIYTVGWIGGTVPHWPGGSGWQAGMSGISNYKGKLVRAHISQSGSFRWGLQGEIR